MASGSRASTPSPSSSPPPPKPRILPIASLRKSPVRVNLHTEQMIEAIRASVEVGRGVPGITVGHVGKAASSSSSSPHHYHNYYIVDGHARVEAYQRAEIEEINVAEVLDLESETDVLIEHVRRNLHSPMNPIKVAAVAGLLAKAQVENPFKSLGLSPVMETAVNVLTHWPNDVLTKLSRVLDMNASRFSDVYALPHFFTAFEELTEKIRRGNKDAEEELRGVISYIAQYLESIGHENEFTLPSPDQVYALMRGRKQRMAAEAMTADASLQEASGSSSSSSFSSPPPSSSSSSSPLAIRKNASKRAPAVVHNKDDHVDEADGERSEEFHEVGNNRDVSDNDVRYKAPLLMPDKNKSIIQCTHCGRPQVVDLKTGHACPLETVADGMIEVIRDGDGKKAYVLGVKAMRFLGLDRPIEEISPSKYSVLATDKKSDVERILRAAKPTSRFVIMVSDYDDYSDNDGK